MGRRVRYQVAMSLDGYIAGPNGECDWILMDPDIDFGTLFAQFDTIVVGRRTYEELAKQGRASMPGMKTVVCSTTLRQSDHPDVTIAADIGKIAEHLRGVGDRDTWLFGGGTLFRSLADAALVDSVEVAVIPVVLGGGIPVAAPGGRIRLALRAHKVYPKSGITMLEYAVVPAEG